MFFSFLAVRLPWEKKDSEQRESTSGSKHETLNHDEFVNVDHRLQLYLELKMFSSAETCQCVLHVSFLETTVKTLNFRTPENFAVIHLKFNKRGQTFVYFVKKMQMEKQTVKTLNRLLL